MVHVPTQGLGNKLTSGRKTMPHLHTFGDGVLNNGSRRSSRRRLVSVATLGITTVFWGVVRCVVTALHFRQIRVCKVINFPCRTRRCLALHLRRGAKRLGSQMVICLGIIKTHMNANFYLISGLCRSVLHCGWIHQCCIEFFISRNIERRMYRAALNSDLSPEPVCACCENKIFTPRLRKNLSELL